MTGATPSVTRAAQGPPPTQGTMPEARPGPAARPLSHWPTELAWTKKQATAKCATYRGAPYRTQTRGEHLFEHISTARSGNASREILWGRDRDTDIISRLHTQTYVYVHVHVHVYVYVYVYVSPPDKTTANAQQQQQHQPHTYVHIRPRVYSTLEYVHCGLSLLS